MATSSLINPTHEDYQRYGSVMYSGASSTTADDPVEPNNFLRTFRGVLKMTQLVIGAVSVGLIGWYIHSSLIPGKSEIFYALMSVSFFVGTFCLVVSSMISKNTPVVIATTAFEFLYHFVACFMYIVVSIALTMKVVYNPHPTENVLLIAVCVMGWILAFLYSLTSVMGVRSYRGDHSPTTNIYG